MNPLPEDAWIDAHHILLSQWNSLNNSSQLPVEISISRVNQFDATRLDVEMSGMLKEQLVKVFSLMKLWFLFQYELESLFSVPAVDEDFETLDLEREKVKKMEGLRKLGKLGVESRRRSL